MNEKKKVLILCTGNSARSQMAEGLLKHTTHGEFDVFSAGTSPSTVRAEAIEALKELYIDISENRSKSVEEFAEMEIDYVLTVCDNARDTCPVFPATTKTTHHSFEDPAAVEGDEKTRLDAFRKVRDEINMFLSEYIDELEE